VTVDTENEPKINILRAEARKKGNLIVIALDMYGNPVDMAQGHGSLICDQNFDCEDKAYNAAVKAVMTCQDRYFRSRNGVPIAPLPWIRIQDAMDGVNGFYRCPRGDYGRWEKKSGRFRYYINQGSHLTYCCDEDDETSRKLRAQSSQAQNFL